MIELDIWFFMVAIPAMIFAGVSKAGFGSGAAFAAGALLALIMPPGLALGVMLPLLMLIDVASLKPYWRKWHGPSALWLIIGAIPGVALASLMFSMTEADDLRLLMGAICLVFVAYQWARATGWLAKSDWPFSSKAGAVAGIVSGFTSFVAHAGGPPAAVFLLGQGMSKTTYQATTVIVFWAINLLKFGPYAYLGIFTWQTVILDLMLAPFALIGAWLGVRAHSLVSERVFFALTYILLTLTGARLIWISLN